MARGNTTSSTSLDAEYRSIPIRPPRAFQVWRQVEIGLIQNAEEYIKESLRRKLRIMGGNSTCADTHDVVRCVKFSKQRSIVRLVKTNITELGYEVDANQDELLERFASYGIVKCPAEAALMLFLEYNDQPTNESLDVVMDYLTTPGKQKNKDWQLHHRFEMCGHKFGRYLTCSNQYGGGTLYRGDIEMLLAYELKT
jgi:hypothetical protein